LGAEAVASLAIAPSNAAMLYAGTQDGDVFLSTNKAGKWTLRRTGLPLNIPITALVVHPDNPATVYAGADGKGVFQSIDAGQHWTAINRGLRGRNILTLGIDSVGSFLHAGTSMNAVSDLQLE
jgi:hypothetical protein